MRRENITLKEERKKLLIEDDREEKELKAYVIRSLAASISDMIPVGGAGSGNGNGGNGGAGSEAEAAKLVERQREAAALANGLIGRREEGAVRRRPTREEMERGFFPGREQQGRGGA